VFINNLLTCACLSVPYYTRKQKMHPTNAAIPRAAFLIPLTLKIIIRVFHTALTLHQGPGMFGGPWLSLHQGPGMFGGPWPSPHQGPGMFGGPWPSLHQGPGMFGGPLPFQCLTVDWPWPLQCLKVEGPWKFQCLRVKRPDNYNTLGDSGCLDSNPVPTIAYKYGKQ